MKTLTSILSLPLLLLVGCQSSTIPCPDEPICEKYIHRYGVSLPQDDWISRGQHGKVVATLKDGVVVSRNYESGVLNGETTYSFPHSETIERTETYADGTLTQESQNYSSGLPKRQTTYQSPTTKSVLEWYENGAPQGKEFYENNALIQAEYTLPSGHVESKVDNQQGFRMNRDQFGQLVSKDMIKNGQIISQTVYYPNGSPKEVRSYANGAVNGQVATFLPGGEPNTIEQWSNGQQHGQTTVFQNGEKFADVPYVSGSKHGVERRYKNKDVVTEDISWNNGCKDGPSRSYVDGQTKTRWYYQDREVSQGGYEVLTRPRP